MIRFPADLTAASFLADYWQKQPLFLRDAVDGPAPALTRNEVGWLATLNDVESRIVFTDRSAGAVRYRAETGPFDVAYLTQLPRRDWTLLVHDVEKHLPELRALFNYVPFIPDWRIDDLMVSFAAPGGGVGPHTDNYDVFLVQGTGVREWHFTTEEVPADRTASDELALLEEFEGCTESAAKGDILYLPPGAPHWGTATRACVTYSIGMRAPQLSDLVEALPDHEADDPFYRDANLTVEEVAPGFISDEAIARAKQLAGCALNDTILGRTVTLNKEWLRPENATADESDAMIESLAGGASLRVHGMARIAWDKNYVYVNGDACTRLPETGDLALKICDSRQLSGPLVAGSTNEQIVRWMTLHGAFELPETS